MTTPDRILLALQACEGISDFELSNHGVGAFLSALQRMRSYASTASYYCATAEKLAELVDKQSKTILCLQEAARLIDQLDQPISDVSEAAGLLSSLSGKTGGRK